MLPTLFSVAKTCLATMDWTATAGSSALFSSSLSFFVALLVTMVTLTSAADLSAATTFPSWGFAGLTLDLNVSHVYEGVIVQVWAGPRACSSPDTARPIVSERIPAGSPASVTSLILNLPSNSVSSGYYSVCAADMYSAANQKAASSHAERQALMARAVEENAPLALWKYQEVGALSIVGLLHAPTLHDANVVPGVFSLQLNSPNDAGAMEQLCTDDRSCATPLSATAAAQIDEANMEHLLSILRVSLFYINPERNVDRCPSLENIKGDESTVPQAAISVAGTAAGIGKWRATAAVADFAGLLKPLTEEGASPEDTFMTCSGPMVPVAPNAGDDVYQGHTLAGRTAFTLGTISSGAGGDSDSDRSLSTPSVSYSSSDDSTILPPDAVFPTSMVRGEPQRFYLRIISEGNAALAADAGCTQLVSPIAPVRNGECVLTAPLCTSNPNSEGHNVVYLCASEQMPSQSSLSSSSVVSSGSETTGLLGQGVVQLLSLFNCAIQQPENVRKVTVPAASPIIKDLESGRDFGITDGFAFEPFLSEDRECTSHRADHGYVATMKLVEERGYVTSESANAPGLASEKQFYVCMTSPDGTLNFTTSEPTLTVTGFALTPRSITVKVATEVSMSPATYFPDYTFITKNCHTAGLPSLEDLQFPGSSSSASTAEPSLSSSSEHGNDAIIAGGSALGAGDTAAITIRASSRASSTFSASPSGGDEPETFLTTLGIYAICTPQLVLPGGLPSSLRDLATTATDSESSTPYHFAYTPVQSFLTIAPPIMHYTSTPVVDSVFCTSATVPGDYYSVLREVDSTDGRYDTYRPYYTSTERAFYLMAVTQAQIDASIAQNANLCAAGHPAISSEPTDSNTVPGDAFSDITYATASTSSSSSTTEGTSSSSDAAKSRTDSVCFNTSGLRVATASGQTTANVYIVCAGTPAGFQQQAAVATTLPVATVSPNEFVSSATTTITIPGFPMTDFIMVSDGATCDITHATLRFTTDGDGNATVTLANTASDEALPAGDYTLCFRIPAYDASDPYQRLRTVQVLATPAYEISIRTFVAGVATEAQLGAALQVSYLLPGFYKDTTCTTAGAPTEGPGAYARWEPVTSKWNAISVISGLPGTVSSLGPLYLCAKDPVDGSLVAFPSASSPSSTPFAATAEDRVAPTTDAADDPSESGIRVITNPMIIANMYVATCVNTNVYFKDSTGTDAYTVALVNGPCCVSSSPVVQQGVATGRGYRTFYVNDRTLERFGPQQEFAVCMMAHSFADSTTTASSAAAEDRVSFARGLCYTPGNITFFLANPSQCLTAGFNQEMPVLGIAARENVLGTVIPKQVNRDDVTGSAAYSWTGLIILTVIAGVVSLLLLLLMIICAACTRKTRAIPDAEKAKEEAMPAMWVNDAAVSRRFVEECHRTQVEMASEWFRSAIQLSPEDIAAKINLRLDRDDPSPVRASRAEGAPAAAAIAAKSATPSSPRPDENNTPGMVEVPVLPSPATVTPVQLQLSPEKTVAEKEEERKRTLPAQLHASEEGLVGAAPLEVGDAESRRVKSVEPTRSESLADDPYAALLAGLAHQERFARRRLLEQEDDDLLAVLERERRIWRDAVSLEGKNIRNLLKEDPFWTSRRQTLQEVNERAFRAALDGTAGEGEDELSATQLDSEGKDRIRTTTPERRGQSGWPRSPSAARPQPQAAATTDPQEVVVVDKMHKEDATPLQRLANSDEMSELDATQPGDQAARFHRTPPRDSLDTSEFSAATGTLTENEFSSLSPNRRARDGQTRQLASGGADHPGPNLLENLLRTIQGVTRRGPPPPPAAADTDVETGDDMKPCVEAPPTFTSVASASLASSQRRGTAVHRAVEGGDDVNDGETFSSASAGGSGVRSLPALPSRPTAAKPGRKDSGTFPPLGALYGHDNDDAEGKGERSDEESGTATPADTAAVSGKDRRRARQAESKAGLPPPAGETPSRELSWSPPSSNH